MYLNRCRHDSRCRDFPFVGCDNGWQRGVPRRRGPGRGHNAHQVRPRQAKDEEGQEGPEERPGSLPGHDEMVRSHHSPGGSNRSCSRFPGHEGPSQGTETLRQRL